jgi:nucleoside-diphosphate-sugar epimerase
MFWNIILFGKEKMYNVGGESIMSILNLSKLIGEELGKNIKVPATDNKLVGNANFVNISIKKYLNEFEKKDFVSIKEGLRNTIEWQKKLYEK